MITLKIIAIIIATLSSLLQIGLEYKWKDKRKKSHKRIRRLLIALIIFSSFSAISLVIYDGKQAKHAMLLADQRARKAQGDRERIQDKLDRLNRQIEPLIAIAKVKYPNLNSEKALLKLSQDLKRIEGEIEKAKSTIYSFSAEITFFIEGDWPNNRKPSESVMVGTLNPSLTLFVFNSSGQPQKLELYLYGMVEIKKEGAMVIINYKAKALPKSWIFGEDFREIKGYNNIKAVLYAIHNNMTIDNKITIKRIKFEIYINGKSTVKFDKNYNQLFTIPKDDGDVTLKIKLANNIK